MSTNTKRVKVVVLCRNASGEPAFHTCTPEVTQEQYDNGDHYDLAKENAEYQGYEAGMAFDAKDAAARQLQEVADWLQGS